MSPGTIRLMALIGSVEESLGLLGSLLGHYRLARVAPETDRREITFYTTVE